MLEGRNDNMAAVSRLKATKTLWGGVASILIGIALSIQGNVPVGLQLVSAGLLAIFVRDAIAKNPQEIVGIAKPVKPVMPTMPSVKARL